MSTITFRTPEQAALYAAGFQHAMEYACDAWELMQHRGRMSVNDRRASLRHFAREYLAQVNPDDPCQLEVPHLEHFEIGYDKDGVFYAKPKN